MFIPYCCSTNCAISLCLKNHVHALVKKNFCKKMLTIIWQCRVATNFQFVKIIAYKHTIKQRTIKWSMSIKTDKNSGSWVKYHLKVTLRTSPKPCLCWDTCYIASAIQAVLPLKAMAILNLNFRFSTRKWLRGKKEMK